MNGIAVADPDAVDPVPVVPDSTGNPNRARLVRGGALLVLAIVLLSLPLYYPDYQLDRFAKLLTYALAAMGLNLLTGLTGQVSVGHAAFFGVGAYSAAILVNDHSWPLLLSIAAAGIVAALVGAVVGLPALRIRGLYLALVTLALAQLFPQVVKRLSWLTGGSEGKPLRSNVDIGGVVKARTVRFDDLTGSFTSSQWTYWVYLLIAAVLFGAAWNLMNSRTGRAMVAIRDNETAAIANGIDVPRVKLATFAVSAAFAGIGGAMYAIGEGNVVPDKFGVEDSIYLLVAVVIGGAATLWGPALGAIVIVFLADLVPENLQPLSRLFQGLALIALIVVAPGGLAGLARQTTARVSARLRSASATDHQSADPAGQEETS